MEAVFGCPMKSLTARGGGPEIGNGIGDLRTGIGPLLYVFYFRYGAEKYNNSVVQLVRA